MAGKAFGSLLCLSIFWLVALYVFLNSSGLLPEVFKDGDHRHWAQYLPNGSEDGKCMGLVKSQYVPFWGIVGILTVLFYLCDFLVQKTGGYKKLQAVAARCSSAARGALRALGDRLQGSGAAGGDVENPLLANDGVGALSKGVVVDPERMAKICAENDISGGVEAACVAAFVVLKQRSSYGQASVKARREDGSCRPIDVEVEGQPTCFLDVLAAANRCLEAAPKDAAAQKAESSDATFTWGTSSKPGELAVSQDGSGRLLVKGTSRRQETAFRDVLEQASAAPEADVWSFPILSDESCKLVQEWGSPTNTLAKYRRSAGQLKTFAEFWAESRDHESSPAVMGDGFEVSYAELRRRVEAVRSALMRHAAAPSGALGRAVVVYMGRTEHIAAAFFGILQAGCVAIPADTHWPEERVKTVAADSCAVLALTDSVSEASWSKMQGVPKSLVVEASLYSSCAATPQAASPHATSCDPENPAVVLFTSGSTGKPKGILLSHRYVMTLAAGRAESLKMDAATRTLMHQSPTWMPFIDYLYGPMLTGGCCVFMPEPHGNQAVGPSELRKMCQKHEVSILGFVPPVLDIFLDEALPSNLRCICVGGAAVPEELSRRGVGALQRAFKDKSGFIATGFSGTEQGDVTQIHLRCEQDVDKYASAKAVMTAGRPHTTQRVAVLDQSLQLLGPECVGEICVAGDGLSSGYLNLPEKSAEAFLPSCQALGGLRTMRTSDLGRWRADGSLEVVGRLGSMVKVRGARVELGEVEATITSHPDVRVCVAAVHQDRLVAYVVPEVPADLRHFCQARMVSYMVPHIFQGLAELPQLANGKVNRKALPAPTEAEGDEMESVVELDSLGKMRKLTRMSVAEDRILDNVRAILMIIVVQSHATPVAMNSLAMWDNENTGIKGTNWSVLAHALLVFSRSGGWPALAFASGFDDTRGDTAYELTYREVLFAAMWFLSGFKWTLWFLPVFVYMRVMFVLAHKYKVMVPHMAVVSQIWLTVPMFIDWYVGWQPAAAGAATECPAQCLCPFEHGRWVESFAYFSIGMWTVGPNLIDHSFVGRALSFVPFYWMGFFQGRSLMKLLMRIYDLPYWKRGLVALLSAGTYMLILKLSGPIERGFDDRCGSFWLTPWSLVTQLATNVAFYIMNAIFALLYVIVVVAVVPVHLKRMAKVSFAAYILAAFQPFFCLLDLPAMVVELRKMVPPEVSPFAETAWLFLQPTLYVLVVGSAALLCIQNATQVVLHALK